MATQQHSGASAVAHLPSFQQSNDFRPYRLGDELRVEVLNCELWPVKSYPLAGYTLIFDQNGDYQGEIMLATAALRSRR